MLSEPQTNVCCLNHLSGTGAEERKKKKKNEGSRRENRDMSKKDKDKRGGVAKKRHRKEIVREWRRGAGGGGGGGGVHGRLTLYSWSLTSHEIGLEYQTWIAPPPPAPPAPPGLSPPLHLRPPHLQGRGFHGNMTGGQGSGVVLGGCLNAGPSG